MSNIKSIGGTEMGAAWTTRYEIDWTEQSSYDFKTSGSATIGGVDWEVGSMVNASAVGVINGQGLVFESDSSRPSQWYNVGGGVLSAPRIGAKVDAGSGPIYGDTGLSQALCFQAIIEPLTELAGKYDEYGLVICSIADWQRYYAMVSRQFDSTTFSNIGGYLLRSVNDSEAYIASGTESAPHRFFEIVFYPGGMVVVSTSADTDFVEPLSATTFQEFITTNSTITSTEGGIAWDKDDMYFIFYTVNWKNYSGSPPPTNFKFAVEKFRMLTLGE